MVKLQVIGHLGKDAILNTVNGKSVINFNVAHAEKYRDAQGQQKDKTLWVECAYWTDRTAIAPYLKKGTQVYAEGTPDIRTYTTGDGRQGASLSLRISSVQLLGGRSDNQNGGEGQSSYNQPSYNQGSPSGSGGSQGSDLSEPLDDLPF